MRALNKSHGIEKNQLFFSHSNLGRSDFMFILIDQDDQVNFIMFIISKCGETQLPNQNTL